MDNRVNFIKSNIDNYNTSNYDLIVSNPPYIKKFKLKSLSEDVKNFDPKIALDGGPSGKALIHKVIKKSSKLLKRKGILILEFDNDQIVAFFAQRIISEIENAWIKPKNIPNLLNCDLKIQVDRNGQITKSELVKSSGNFRFDNSSLTAVTRVNRFSFFNEISDDMYLNNFKIIFLNFNPYE